MTNVIKKDDRREDFSRDKIKRGIESAARRAKVDQKRSRDIADKVARKVEDNFRNRDEVRSSDIRNRVVSELEKENKSLAKEFRSFRKD